MTAFAWLRAGSRALVTLVAGAGIALAAPAARAMTIERVISPGGIEAWLVRDHTLPLIAVEFAFLGSADQDPMDKPGVANLATSLLDEGAGPFDANAFHACYDRLIRNVGRMQLHEFGAIGEVSGRRHGIHLNLWRRLHIHARVDLCRHRLRCLAPARERRDLVACLNFVNCVVVLRSVSLGPADYPDIGSRRGDV